MARPELAAARLTGREVRNGSIVLIVAVAGIVASVVASFSQADLSGSGGLGALVENPAVRALYGMPFDVSTAGGFAVWRAGTFICVIGALWGILVSTRVLRGEEEAGRWDLLLTAPVSRWGLLSSHLVVLSVVAALGGAGIVVGFATGGQALGAALLYGAGVALLTVTFVGVGAMTSQLFGVRRRAAGAAGAVLGVSYLIRMVADGSSSLAWLRWASPLGWVENLQAYADDNWLALVPLVVVAALVFASSFALERIRDIDEGVIRDPGTAVARTRFLRDPLGMAWRQRQGGLVGWAGGILAFGVILGAITKAFVDFIAGDPAIERMTAEFGFTSLSSPVGFIASMDALCAVVVCLYAVVGIHQLWEDELSDRLDLVFATSVSRTSWLAAQTLTSGLVAFIALLAMGLGTWVGVTVAGVDLGLDESLAAALNTLPLLALFLGLAVMVHGIRPQLVTTVAGGLVAGTYLLSFLGPAVGLPQWAIDLSPWMHVSVAPAAPVDWVATIVMSGVGTAFGVVGFLVYARRDLR